MTLQNLPTLNKTTSFTRLCVYFFIRFLIIILIIIFSLLFFFRTSIADFSASDLVNSQNLYAKEFNAAAQEYGISPLLLYSIAEHESNMYQYAINKNTNGSYDYGLMQINTSNLSWLGLNASNGKNSSVYNVQLNVAAGAHVLSGCFQVFGSNQLAIDCYNKGYNRNILSADSAYVKQVMAIFDSLSTTGKLTTNPQNIVEKGVNSVKTFLQKMESIFGMPLVIAILLVVVFLIIVALIALFPVIASIVSGIISILIMLYKIYSIIQTIKAAKKAVKK